MSSALEKIAVTSRKSPDLKTRATAIAKTKQAAVARVFRGGAFLTVKLKNPISAAS
jgi:hypothetical protein